MQKQWIGCAAENFRKGRRAPYRPEAIVVHIMAGSLKGTDLWFGNTRSGVSAHYGIGKNGEIHQYVEEEDTAFHAGTVDNPSWEGMKRLAGGGFANPNYYTIGIEHEGFPGDVWPEAQMAASGALIADIAARWGIPLDRRHIVKHHEIRAVKPCPGGDAPVDALIQRAQAGATPAQAAPLQVVVTSRLNVRVGSPTTASPIRRVIAQGATVDVVGFTATGQSVSGNPFWYRDAAGDFLWAGATDRPHPSV